jgi:ABC-type nitrate/sulfonate/bicarbonate transport system permease component
MSIETTRSALPLAPPTAAARRWGKGSSILGIVAVRVLGFGLLLAVWAAAATQFLAVQLPRPQLVWEALRDNFSTAEGLALQGLSGGYFSNVLYSISNAFVAFLVGAIAGFVIGCYAGRRQWVRNCSAPLLLLFGTVPDLVAAPFLLVWLGPGRAPQFIIVAFYCFVVVGVASQTAALGLPPRYEEFAATLGASARDRMAIVFRAVLPAVIGATRVALATAWSLQAVGELLGSESGVGRVVTLSQQLGDTAGSMAVICLLGAIAVAIDAVVTFALRLTCRWQAVVSQ